ncbi:MAG: hypothetical protein ACFE9T_04445 [Promethearchaeota archaeon]
MTAKNPVSYCPYCKKNVSLSREGINIPLAILLAIFTGGIGLLIYLAIYHKRDKDRCNNCGSQININKALVQPYFNQKSSLKLGMEEVKGDKVYFCPYCGEKLDDRRIKYCSNCGSDVDIKQ